MRKRSRNSGRLLAKTGSNDQLSDDVKTSEKSLFKTNHFCKMIVLFSITKQLPTNIMTKLWRLIRCVMTSLNYDYFLNFKTNHLYTEFTSTCIQFKQNPNIFAGLTEIFSCTKIYRALFNWSALICSIETCTVRLSHHILQLAFKEFNQSSRMLSWLCLG